MSDNPDGKLPPIEEKEDLTEIYKNRGFQKQNLKDYIQLKKQQDQKKKSALPAAVKIILSTPLLLLFCIGLVFIPYMTYLFITTEDNSKTAVEEKTDQILLNSDI